MRRCAVQPIPGNYIEHEPWRIPWVVAEIAYEAYAAQNGQDQSLQTIHDRAGFGAIELLSLLTEATPEMVERVLLRSALASKRGRAALIDTLGLRASSDPVEVDIALFDGRVYIASPSEE